MSQTIFKSRRPNPVGRFILWLDYNETGQAAYMAQDIMNGFLGPMEDEYENAKAKYSEYFDNIRQKVAKGNLLEFDLKDGYGPLCDFLGAPEPTEVDPETGEKRAKPFPHINETTDYQDRMQVLYRRTALRVLTRYVAKPLGLTACAVLFQKLIAAAR